MCGIFGAIRFDGGFNSNEIQQFQQSVEIVSHRGPDGDGHKLFFTSDSKTNVFLGHRRLSIIDLSAGGNQPMGRDGNWIVFNGEIFNYIEIRKELESYGYKFTSDSDTEVILRTYQHFGPKGFKAFNGMWAFIIYDMANQKIIASRDRFSIKPLNYFMSKTTIYFSSEFRQILPYLETKSINKSVLTSFLLQGLQDHTNQTFYTDIHKVPPKSYLTLDLKQRTKEIETYWDYMSSGIINEEEAIEKFRETLQQSIMIRLRSDVEVGCLLSGGLDSSLISVIANQNGVQPIRTFSVISKDKAVNEEKFIDIMVGERSLQNQKILFDPKIASRYLDQTLFYQEQPFGGASVIAQFMVYNLIKENAKIKVVLSGQGGDEVLMGYLKYFFFYLGLLAKNRKYFKALKEIFYSIMHRTAVAQLNLGQAKRYIPGLATKKLNYINSRDPLIKIWKTTSIQDRQINDLDHFSVPALTHLEDRNSMGNSIESRVPFLDHNVVDLLVHLPDQLKFKNGWSKYLLRKSSYDLPERVRWRRDKKGFTVPEDHWCKNELKCEIENIRKNSYLAELGIFNPKNFDNYYQNFLNEKYGTNSKEIFSVYIAEKWLKTLS